MKNSFIISCLLLLPSCQANAQSWARNVGGTGHDEMNEMAIGPDGSIYTAGFFQNPIMDDTSYSFSSTFLMRWSPTGELLWEVAIDPVAGGGIKGMAVDSAGNVYIGGFADGQMILGNDTIPDNQNHYRAMVARFDANGNYQWLRYCTTSIPGLATIIHDLVMLPNGTIVASGGADPPGMMYWQTDSVYGAFIMHMDLNGNELEIFPSDARMLEADGTNHYYAIPPSASTVGTIRRYDHFGSLVIEFNTPSIIEHLAADSAGVIWVHMQNEQISCYDIWGSWQHDLTLDFKSFWGIAVNNQNHVALAYKVPLDDVNYGPLFIRIIDPQMNVLGTEIYGQRLIDYGSHSTTATNLHLTKNLNVVVAGMVGGSGPLLRQFLFGKDTIQQIGSLDGLVQFIEFNDILTSTTARTSTEQQPLAIYPNPASQVLHLRWATTQPRPRNARLLTLQGKPVANWQLPAQAQNTLQLPLGLAPGAYLLELSNTECRNSQLLVLQ